MRRHAALVLTVLTAACARGAVVTGASPASATAPAALTADMLRQDLTAFASDEFRGRETGTPDADRAARWLAERLQQAGVEPAGDSGFFHRVPMSRDVVRPVQMQLTTPAGRTALRPVHDLVIATSLGAGAPLPRLSADAEVVFGSYGIVNPQMGRNDLDGLELRDRIVVVVNAAPAGTAAAQVKQFESFDAIGPRLAQVLPKQPAGIVVLLHDTLYAQVAAQFGGVQVTYPAQAAQPAAGPRPLPMIAFAPIRAGTPFAPNGAVAGAAGALRGVRLAAGVEARREQFTGYNVVGVVRGSDAAMRGTYVAYGSHYDHIGVIPGATGDSVNNGADDDGSGTVAMLAVARAFAQGEKPRRSALFVFHVGEEKGLFGSAHFAANPTVPMDSIVAQLNADMVGRNHPDTLYVVGPQAAPNNQSRALGAVVDSVNARQSKAFAFNREWDNPSHPERIYFRSDHYSYAQKGVPVVFFTTGLHPQYHQPSDEVALIDFDKMSRVSRLFYDLGFAIANRADRPR